MEACPTSDLPEGMSSSRFKLAGGGEDPQWAAVWMVHEQEARRTVPSSDPQLANHQASKARRRSRACTSGQAEQRQRASRVQQGECVRVRKLDQGEDHSNSQRRTESSTSSWSACFVPACSVQHSRLGGASGTHHMTAVLRARSDAHNLVFMSGGACECRHVVSIVIGGLLGMGVSWIANSTLLEISVSNFFSFCEYISIMSPFSHLRACNR